MLTDILPQQPEVDEPGSVQYNYHVWRQQRNEHVIEDTEKQAREAGEMHRACHELSCINISIHSALQVG